MQDDFDYSSCDRDGVAAPSIRGEQFGSYRIKTNHSQVEVGAEVEGVIGIIESRTFLRECIRRSMQSLFQATIVTYSDFYEFENEIGHSRPSVILLPLVDGTVEGAKQSLNNLSGLVPNVPVIVICYKNDFGIGSDRDNSWREGLYPGYNGFRYRGRGCEICSGRRNLRASGLLFYHRFWARAVRATGHAREGHGA